MKQVLLKKIVIVMGKLIRSKVLWGGAGLYGAPRGRMGKKIFPVKRGGGEDTIFWTHPTPLPSLCIPILNLD